MKPNPVFPFEQLREAPLPPYGSHIVMRRSMGIMFDVVEVRHGALFQQDSMAAFGYQMQAFFVAWEAIPAGTLPNDASQIMRMVRLRGDRNAARDFERHREDILRGWYLCRDGLLYHPWLTRRVMACWDHRRRDVREPSDADLQKSGFKF